MLRHAGCVSAGYLHVDIRQPGKAEQGLQAIAEGLRHIRSEDSGQSQMREQELHARRFRNQPPQD